MDLLALAKDLAARVEAKAAFDQLAGELIPAHTLAGDAWILADDEAAFQQSDSQPVAPANGSQGAPTILPAPALRGARALGWRACR